MKLWVFALHADYDHGLSRLEYGWEMGVDGIEPIMYTGPTAAEKLDDLVCSCKGKRKCTDCTCYRAGFLCIELCSCEGDEQICENISNFLCSDSLDK